VGALLFLGLLAAVGIVRCTELAISRRHRRALLALGAPKIADPHFPWMVLLHAGVLVAAALEVVLLKRPLIPVLAITAGAVFVAANVLRWWVIRSLGAHWNVQVVDSVRLGVVTRGPFRLVRHPNYVAVFLELAALPLIHTAWLTALVGSLAHVWVLSRRLEVEEAVLRASPEYFAAMGHKPRFVPSFRKL
jgi:methyltransferase